jgi:hypothetical protein
MDENKWCDYYYPSTQTDPPEGCENELDEGRSYCTKHAWCEDDYDIDDFYGDLEND